MFAAVVGAFVLIAQAGNPIVSPPPVSSTTKVDVTVQAPPLDPKAVGEASVTSFQAVVVQLIAPTMVGWVNDLLDIPDIYRTTPPGLTYQNQGVRSLADQVRLVAGGLVVLAVVAIGIAFALAQRPSVGRLVFGVALAAGNLIWWQWAIDLNNAINAGIAAPDVKSIVRPNLSLPTIGADPAAAFGPAVLVIVYSVVLLLLLGSLALRLGFLDVLIAIGSLALLCKATEQSDGFYSKYVTLSVGTTFSQVLIVVCLKLAPILGGLGTGVVGTILGVVVLLLARRMPALLSSASNQSRVTILPLLLLRRAFMRL